VDEITGLVGVQVLGAPGEQDALLGFYRLGFEHTGTATPARRADRPDRLETAGTCERASRASAAAVATRAARVVRSGRVRQKRLEPDPSGRSPRCAARAVRDSRQTGSESTPGSSGLSGTDWNFVGHVEPPTVHRRPRRQAQRLGGGGHSDPRPAGRIEVGNRTNGRGERSRTSITDLSVRSRRLRCAVIGADRSLIRVG
jgi:hypothetical protein